MIACIMPPLLHRADFANDSAGRKLREQGVPDGNVLERY